eukprot:129318-Prymnesium_polylepis.1
MSCSGAPGGGGSWRASPSPLVGVPTDAHAASERLPSGAAACTRLAEVGESCSCSCCSSRVASARVCTE